MIGVDLIGQIRCAYFDQHRPIKEIVRTLCYRARRCARSSAATRPSVLQEARCAFGFRSSVTAMFRISLPPWFQGFVGG
jgi:hypothetical protein